VTGRKPVTFSAYLRASRPLFGLTGVTGGLWGKRDIFRKDSDSFRRNPFPEARHFSLIVLWERTSNNAH
jgi:hypothetical protein